MTVWITQTKKPCNAFITSIHNAKIAILGVKFANKYATDTTLN